MKKKDAKAGKYKKLRARAEKDLKKRIEKIQKRSKGDFKKVIHELEVHQIELEMQNEELRRAEDSRNKYSDLYDFAPVGYFTFDKDGLILEANLTGSQMLGVARGALIKKPFHIFVSKESQDRYYLHRQAVSRSTAKQSCEITLKRKDGETFGAMLESISADTKGDFFYRTAVTNITDRNLIEKKLEKVAAELERSNEDLEQFAYVVSHDLREPLRGINGFMDLLYKAYKDKLDEKAIEYIKYATDSAKRMDDLLTSLLRYSHVQTQEKSFAPIPIRGALRAALANLKMNIDETGACITSDELPTVAADGIQMTELFQNLIANAIKFRGDQKPQIHVGCQKQKDCWQFSVQDNGIGIDQQFNERIFVIFQRLHARDKYPGYGIGLSICRRIVERHGGRIWVESQPGQGTTFCFTIPVN